MMNICEKVLFGLTEQAHLRLYIVAWEKTGDGGTGSRRTRNSGAETGGWETR